MNTIKSTLLILTLSFFVTQLHADSELTERMKARLSEVVTAKDKGLIGESVDGLLLIRNTKADSKTKDLVKAENLDRKSLFKLLAKQTGGEVDLVAKKFAKGIAARAKKGHWFKNSSGNWTSK